MDLYLDLLLLFISCRDYGISFSQQPYHSRHIVAVLLWMTSRRFQILETLQNQKFPMATHLFTYLL